MDMFPRAKVSRLESLRKVLRRHPVVHGGKQHAANDQEHDTMEWLKLVSGVMVGAMIPIVVLFLKERIDARHRLSEWFEKKYIEDSIDVLHEFFSKWALLSALPARNVQELLSNPAFAEVPSQAAGRLASITGGVAFQNWFNAMRGQWLRAAHQGDWNQLIKFHTHAASFAEHLNALRRELLSQKMTAKADAYQLRESAYIKRFNQLLGKMTEDLVSNPNVKTYTAEPSSTGDADPGANESR